MRPKPKDSEHCGCKDMDNFLYDNDFCAMFFQYFFNPGIFRIAQMPAANSKQSDIRKKTRQREDN